MIISFFVVHPASAVWGYHFSFHRDEPTIVILAMTKKDCIKEDVLIRGRGEQKIRLLYSASLK